MFEEERRKLLRDNNLTDSDSREKRILTALRAEMDPSRIIPGKHASADREIQDWVRDFVGAFGATKKIWFNQDLTPKRRFVGNSSRRTVNVFDEMYPTNIRESEIEFSIPTTTTLTTFLSLETLYDGLDTSEGDDSRTPPTGDEAKTKMDHQAVPKAANARDKGKAGAKAKLESLVNTQSRVKARGRPKKADVKAEAKVGQKKRKASETVMKKMSKRAKRSVGDTDKLPVDRMKRDAPQAEPEDVMADEDVPFTNSQGQCSADLKTEEVIKSRMDSDDKKVYDQIMTNVKNFKERRRNNSLSQAPVRALDRPVERTTKEKRKPTYRYTSRDVEEAERKWKEVQKMKRKKMEKHNKKRKSRSVDDPYDPVINKSAFDAFQDALYNGKTIHTLDNSTPPYEFFQQKVYPSHTINSEQLNDESFCRKILPKLEEDNKMMVSELKRRATEHYEQQKKEKHQDLSEVNEDDSFEQHLAPAEPSNTKEEAVTNRRKKREEKSDSLDESDLRRCEKINAQLKAEGYDREKIMRELNVTKNEHGELVAGRRKKRSLVRDNSLRRRRRDVRLVNKPKRVKRKTGKDSDGEYVEDMSRYKEGKRIHNQLQHDLRQYKGQEGESGPVENVIRHYENNKKIYDQPDYRKKRDLNNQPYNVKAPRRAKREEKSDSLDESDLRRCEKINAQLKAEGYDREKIMRELNVTKNEHGELVAGRRKKRSLVRDNSVRRRRRDVRLVNKPKRVKRKTGKDSDGEYVEDMSRYKEGKRIHNQLQHDLRQYKGQEGESGPVENVIRHYENNKKIYDQPDYRKKRDLNNQPYNVKAPRRAKREEKSDSLDESDLRRCEKINAQLKAEGYDREKIMRELNVTKNEHGELVAGRRKKRSLVRDNSVRNLERQIRDKVRAQFPKREGPPSGNKSVSLDQLKRNLEIYDLIEEWKEQQVKLAMVTSKERRMLNEIDRLRDELGIPHGKDDPYYQAAVKEAIRRENEHAKLYAKEIDEWWEKEEKERRAAEAIAIANYFNTNQTGNEDFDKEKERLEEEQLDIIQKKHEKEMAERVAKGLPPDDYDELLPLAKKEMEEEQKKYEEHCRNCPKTVDELMKDFEGDADVSQLKRNLEVYDLIEKWKKRQAKKEKQQQNKQKKRKRRDVLIARSKDALNMLKMRLENIMSRQVKPKPAQVDQPDFQVEDDYEFKRYKNTTVYEFVYDTTEEKGQQTNQTHKLQPVVKGLWPEPFISDSDGKWDQIAKEKLNSEESSMTEEVEEEAKGKAKPIRSKKAHNVLAQARYRMKETLLRRKARSVNETDMHHEGFNKELNRMIDEHIEKRKVSPYTPKIRPTAASEYPTKDDFQPFMRFSSAEMKEHQKQEQAKERFALFKAMDVIYGPTTVDDSDSYDSKEYARELATTKSTTPTKSASERSYDKIQKLRSFMRKTLDETGRKISEVMIRLNATKGPGDSEEMRRAGIPEEWYSLQAAKATGQSIQTETTTTEKPFKFYKKYDYNPDDVLHKKEVTFAFGERIDTTTPAEEYTFSPFYTYVQRYNQHNYSDDMAEKETAIVFSQTHAADWTMSPFYNFHRYYHELNDSVDRGSGRRCRR
ncbi:trichohyalin-like [Diaphorina citri]|uniref:Trichohyalin-like n=1 Tax=Diaphorina citri TaxID=121845 RepID=A0A3Q0JCV7_DIACI|nr:trichohyalin-like [Diaphorina citri]